MVTLNVIPELCRFKAASLWCFQIQYSIQLPTIHKYSKLKKVLSFSLELMHSHFRDCYIQGHLFVTKFKQFQMVMKYVLKYDMFSL